MIEIEGEYISKMRSTDLENKIQPLKRENPFKDLYNWAKHEVLNVNTMLEAIQDKNDLEAQKHYKLKQLRKATKHKTKSDELSNNAGTEYVLKFVNKITKKSKEKISLLEKEIEDYDQVIQIMTGKLCYEEIPNFRNTRAQEFDKMIVRYMELVSNEFHKFADTPKNNYMLMDQENLQ